MNVLKGLRANNILQFGI